MTRVVALYCRLSPRPDDDYAGVAAQERAGRVYAEKTWPGVPVEVFADEGISASNGDVRPGLERLREWVADRRVAHLWAVEQRRVSRETDGRYPWFKLAAEFDLGGVPQLHTARDGVVNVRDEVSGIKAVLAEHEIRRLKMRVNDRLDDIAAQGIPPGVKPYGYEHTVTEDGVRTYRIVPEQAEAIRFAADKVLDGWSLSNIARELDGRGLRGVHGGRITAEAVKNFLTMPSVAGKRVHRGEVIRQGNWPAILEEPTWQAVCAKLAAPRTVKRVDGGTYPIGKKPRRQTGRRYLLTGGLARCGVCDAHLTGSMKQFRRNGDVYKTAPYLVCHPTKGGRGCIGIMLDPVEDYVADRMFDYLDSPKFIAALAADDHAARRDEIGTALADIETVQRPALAKMWATKELKLTEWAAARAELDEQERQLHAELNAIPAPVSRVDPADLRAAWATMPLDEQRQALRTYVDKVIIHRSRPGAPRRLDLSRVEIVFRDAA